MPDDPKLETPATGLVTETGQDTALRDVREYIRRIEERLRVPVPTKVAPTEDLEAKKRALKEHVEREQARERAWLAQEHVFRLADGTKEVRPGFAPDWAAYAKWRGRKDGGEFGAGGMLGYKGETSEVLMGDYNPETGASSYDPNPNTRRRRR